MVVLVLVLHFFPHLFSRSELPVELREEEKEQAQKILLGSTRMEQTWWVFSRYCLYFFAVLCCTEKIRELSILSSHKDQEIDVSFFDAKGRAIHCQVD